MSESRGPSIGFVLAAVLLLWLGLGVSASTFWPVFASGQFVLAAGVAILAGTTVAAMGARWRWSSLVVSLVAVGAFALLGVPLAVPAKALGGVLPSLPGLADLFAG
ncbi:MAG TPA: transglutaminase domain-containing protein, partial [Terrimesophilobacter sp.]|nr:transglutaminase domain-containing protein [Terrimesophilobacter sp.]